MLQEIDWHAVDCHWSSRVDDAYLKSPWSALWATTVLSCATRAEVFLSETLDYYFWHHVEVHLRKCEPVWHSYPCQIASIAYSPWTAVGKNVAHYQLNNSTDDEVQKAKGFESDIGWNSKLYLRLFFICSCTQAISFTMSRAVCIAA